MTNLREKRKKNYEELMGKFFPSSATTFEELELEKEWDNLLKNYDDLFWQLTILSDNIIFNTSEEDKKRKLRELAKSFSDRVESLLEMTQDMENFEKMAEREREDSNAFLHSLEKVNSLDNEESLFIYKTKDNSNPTEHYLYGIFSNAVTDKQKDVFTLGAHEKWIKTLDTLPYMSPPLWVYHIPHTAFKHKAEFWGMEDQFPFHVWPLEKEEKARIDNFSKDFTPAMSHQSLGLEVEKGKPTKIHSYICLEASLLDSNDAANSGTSFSII